MKKRNIIFLHGIADSIRIRNKLLCHPKFKLFNIYSLPIPGDPDLKYLDFKNLDEYTEFFAKQVKNLKLSDYILIGFSFGGMIVHNYNYKYSHDKKLQGSVIWASPLNGRSTVMDLIYKYAQQLPISSLDTEFIYKNVEILSNLGIPVSAYQIEDLVKTDKRFIINGLRIIEEDKIDFADIKSKRLYLFGSEDMFAPKITYELVRKRYETDKDVQVSFIKKGGHFGTKEGLLQSNNVILDFINKHY